MSAIAHVLEAHGLATIALSLVRGQVESSAPPRALHCDFPLGRPLGVPGDNAFQRRVLEAAFGLLDAPVGPVLVDYAERVEATADMPLTCTLPPRDDAGRHPAIAEMLALAPAFARAPQAVEVDTDPTAVEASLEALIKIADGVSMEEAGVDDPRVDALRIRAYYDRAARALSDHVPGARSAETWFFHKTESGKVVLEARSALKASGASKAHWVYLAPLPYVVS